MKNQIRWANTPWGKFADWLKTLKLWGQKRLLRRRWQWCWREQKCLLLNCWRGWWWVIHFHFLLFDHKEREKRKARSSRKVEHRKEISTSSLPVSDQHSSCQWSFQWFCCLRLILIFVCWFFHICFWMFSLQLSAHERSHQRSRSAQPLVKLAIIFVAKVLDLICPHTFPPYSTIQVLWVFILYWSLMLIFQNYRMKYFPLLSRPRLAKASQIFMGEMFWIKKIPWFLPDFVVVEIAHFSKFFVGTFWSEKLFFHLNCWEAWPL